MSVKVLIGIPRRESAPSTSFYDCLAALETVPGTCIGKAGRTGVLPGARNRIVREAREMDAEFVWWLDDDALFAPDALVKLLAHDVDVVTGLHLKRKPPFAPYLYDWIDAESGAHQYWLQRGDHGLRAMPGGGAGMNGLLIRRSVLDAMGDPWFTFERLPGNNDDYAEDFPFYRRIAEMGVTFHVAFNVRFGHEFRCGLWPTKNKDGNWETVMADDAPFLGMPAAAPAPGQIIIPRPERIRAV